MTPEMTRINVKNDKQLGVELRIFLPSVFRETNISLNVIVS